MRTGPRNTIADVPGLKVGVAHDVTLRTGVTVILPDQRSVAAVDVGGGGTGTRETELLGADGTVDEVDALVLGGGSAFGLAAADGVTGWLSRQGRGFPVGDIRVPLVPAAILFDLLNGGDKQPIVAGAEQDQTYPALGRRAAEQAGLEVGNGNFGAGYGATTTGHDGRRLKGGQGTASCLLAGGISVGAIVAVNALGSTVANGAGQFLAGMLEHDDEFGGLGGPGRIESTDHPISKNGITDPGGNTTIAVVATDAALDPRQARRVAVMAQAGLARAIRPVFTPMDGDVVFAVSTGREPVPDVPKVAQIGMAAADCLARAVARGVFHAESLDAAWPSYSQAYAS